METLPFVRQFAIRFLARYFTDTGACFLLLSRMSGGTVPFYSSSRSSPHSSSREQSRTLGREEANYYALVS